MESENKEKKDGALNQLKAFSSNLRDAVAPPKPLQRGDYQVQVHIIEVRDLIGVDFGDISDPVVSVSIMKETKNTSIKHRALSCVFDEVLYFEFIDKHVIEIEQGKVLINVYDANKIRRNVIIGSYEFDLSYVYFREHHEVFHQWVALIDDTGKRQGIQGYLKCSITVLGPNDEQFTHSIAEVNAAEGGNMLSVLVPPTIDQTPRQLHFYIIAATHLPKMDKTFVGTACDPYVKIDFAGQTVKTKHLEGQDDIVFNTELLLPVYEPIMSKKVTISLYDWDATSSDDRIATFTINYDDIVDGVYDAKPFWFFCYGAPEGYQKNHASLMNRNVVPGSFYRGKLLMFAKVTDSDLPKNAAVDYGGMITRPKLIPYVLQLDVYEGIEIPSLGKMSIELCIENLVFPSSPVPVVNGTCSFYQTMHDKDSKDTCYFYLPENAPRLPDVFIYLVYDKERICFIRHTFKDILDAGFDVPPRWNYFNEDKARDSLSKGSYPGALLYSLRGGLKSKMPPSISAIARPLNAAGGLIEKPRRDSVDMKQEPVKQISTTGTLSVEIIRGSNLPVTDRMSGSSDPFVVISVSGSKKFQTKHMKKNLNPVWNETFTLLQHPIAKPIQLQLFDYNFTLNTKIAEIEVDLRSMSDKSPGESFDTNKELLLGNAFKNAKLYIRIKYLFDKPGTVTQNIVTAKTASSGSTTVLARPPRTQYVLRCMVYQARNLIAADDTGLADPFLRVSFCGASAKTTIKMETLSPLWYEVVSLVVSVPYPFEFAPYVICELWDYDQITKDDELGRIMLSVPDILKLSSEEPKWYELLDTENNSFGGEILLNFQLLSTEDAQRTPVPSLIPESKDMLLDLSTLGLRNLNPTIRPTKTFIEYIMPNGKHYKTSPSNLPYPINPNFCQNLHVPVTIPKNPLFSPALNCEIHDIILGGFAKPIIGTASINLEPILTAYIQAVEKEKERKLKLEQEKKAIALRNKTRESVPEPPNLKETKVEIVVETVETKQESTTASSTLQESKRPSLSDPAVDTTPLIHPGTTSSSSTTSDLVSTTVTTHQEVELTNLEPRNDEKEEKEPLLKDVAIDIEDSKDEKMIFDDKQHCILVDIKQQSVSEAETAPTYMKGRKTYDNELEDEISLKPFTTIDIYTGKKNAGFFAKENRKMGQLKGIFNLREVEKKFDNSSVQLKPQEVIVRVYVLTAKNLIPRDINGSSDPYLIVKCGEHEVNCRSEHFNNELNPEFFQTFEFPVKLPGASTVDIDCYDYDIVGDDLIGSTVIDIEDRWFSKNWLELKKKPLEYRTLHSPRSTISQGKLALWVDILRPDAARIEPLIDIKPPPPTPFELRVIVWGCTNVVSKDEITEMNDLFITSTLEGIDGYDLPPQSTDTHLRAQDGVGNFNWRMIFPITLPTKQDPRLRFQIYDMDIFKSNDFICTAYMSLKGLCDLARKTNKRVKLQDAGDDKIPLTGLKHPNFSGSQGDLEISIELIPASMGAQLPVGFGRSSPNQYPYLPEPEGRMVFSFNPLTMLKQICGKKLYLKICLGMICALLLSFLGFITPSLLSNLITKGL